MPNFWDIAEGFLAGLAGDPYGPQKRKQERDALQQRAEEFKLRQKVAEGQIKLHDMQIKQMEKQEKPFMKIPGQKGGVTSSGVIPWSTPSLPDIAQEEIGRSPGGGYKDRIGANPQPVVGQAPVAPGPNLVDMAIKKLGEGQLPEGVENLPYDFNQSVQTPAPVLNTVRPPVKQPTQFDKVTGAIQNMLGLGIGRNVGRYTAVPGNWEEPTLPVAPPSVKAPTPSLSSFAPPATEVDMSGMPRKPSGVGMEALDRERMVPLAAQETQKEPVGSTIQPTSPTPTGTQQVNAPPVDLSSFAPKYQSRFDNREIDIGGRIPENLPVPQYRMIPDPEFPGESYPEKVGEGTPPTGKTWTGTGEAATMKVTPDVPEYTTPFTKKEYSEAGGFPGLIAAGKVGRDYFEKTGTPIPIVARQILKNGTIVTVNAFGDTKVTKSNGEEETVDLQLSKDGTMAIPKKMKKSEFEAIQNQSPLPSMAGIGVSDEMTKAYDEATKKKLGIPTGVEPKVEKGKVPASFYAWQKDNPGGTYKQFREWEAGLKGTGGEKTKSAEQLARGDLRKQLGREPTDGEVRKELQTEKLELAEAQLDVKSKDIDIKAISKAVAEGQDARIAVKGSMGNPVASKVQSEVLKKYPNFDFNMSDANYKWKQSQINMRTVNFVGGSLPRLEALSNQLMALKNTDIPAINAVMRQVAIQTGKPEFTNFESNRNAIVQEVNTALSGSATGSDMRIKIELENLQSSRSPAQIIGAINNLREALIARLDVDLSPLYPLEVVQGTKSLEEYKKELYKKYRGKYGEQGTTEEEKKIRPPISGGGGNPGSIRSTTAPITTRSGKQYIIQEAP